MAHHAAADARLAATAVAQHGVFTRVQAIAAGFSAQQIDRRRRAGAWVRVYPRVYRHATTPPTTLTTFAAAALWAGSASALSHTSAGTLWRLDGVRPAVPEVVVSRGRAPRAAGVVVHRVRDVDRSDLAMIAGLAVTGPVRTLIDLAAVLDDGELAVAIASARDRGLATPDAVSARLARLGASGTGRPGVRRLRRALAAAAARAG